MRRLIFFLITIILCGNISAQNSATVYGYVRDSTNQPLPFATVGLLTGQGTFTDNAGKYSIAVPAGINVQIKISFLGYADEFRTVNLAAGAKTELDFEMHPSSHYLGGATIYDVHIRNEAGMQKIEPKAFETLPSTTGGIEAALKVLGAGSNNELSSQYSVRGGNFDENLVYVNDFEIFRPFLIRSGQQEGLSFIDPDLVSGILFSTGGFQSRYGDKMSSVLDIRYKHPVKFKGNIAISLLGESGYVEGSSKAHRFRYLFGIRQKSNQYLLGALDAKGDYKPSFTDVQANLSFDITDKTTLEYLGNYARNQYRFLPDSQSTSFGTVNAALLLHLYFEGQELDRYQSFTQGISITTRPNQRTTLKYLASVYNTNEEETYDIIGQYFIGELEGDLGKSGFGDVKYQLGVGTNHDWARNFLDAWVEKFSHKGSYAGRKNYAQWGFDIQHEQIDDQIKVWNRVDSAGYSLPYSDTAIFVKSYLTTHNSLASFRYSVYAQDAITIDSLHDMNLTFGMRAGYWDLNQQFIWGPRVQFTFKPQWTRDFVFKFSSGVYNQPPFYRELRDLEGVVHTNVKAQQSIHFVAGTDYKFTAWGRGFTFVSEAYYKMLNHLNPYEVDNVRIIYFANNSAHGYATGVDFRLNGELVKDAESWVSLSLLQTQENVDGDSALNTDGTYSPVGFIPRPTDQRFNFGMFMQDYLPMNHNFKVHLNFLLGSGLPFGPPDHHRYLDTLRIPPYRRVDIGFSALLFDKSKHKDQQGVLRHFRTIWTSLEVFNLLGVSNTVSYLWIKDLNDITYAVPNYLTSRRVNLRVLVKF